MGWHEHVPELFHGTERFFRPGYAANLVSSWIPSLDGVEALLKDGAKIADVGCGLGSSTILMAQAYPNSTVVGFDYHAPSIEWARQRAAEAGVGDRVRFEVAKAKEYPGGDYDLVTFFDCLHYMGDPKGAAAHVRETLKATGTWMIVERFAGSPGAKFKPVRASVLQRFHFDLYTGVVVTGGRYCPRSAGRGSPLAPNRARRRFYQVPPRSGDTLQFDFGSEAVSAAPVVFDSGIRLTDYRRICRWRFRFNSAVEGWRIR